MTLVGKRCLVLTPGVPLASFLSHFPALLSIIPCRPHTGAYWRDPFRGQTEVPLISVAVSRMEVALCHAGAFEGTDGITPNISDSDYSVCSAPQK
jgi:hypothetical protein